MQENENTEATVVKEAMKNGATTVTILTGNAPKQPEIFNPKSIKISGTIDAPSRFAAIRDFEQKRSHALVSISRGEIIMTVNEQNTDDTHEIKGRVIIGREFAALGINADKEYTSESLAKHLKLKRSLFESHTEHTKLIAALRSIKAKVQQSIEKAKDDKGNETDAFTQTVESNMPESFTMLIPLIEGQSPQRIEVFPVLEADGRDIVCTLESMDAAEGIDQYRAEAVLEEVEKIKDKTTVIFTE
jgi:hypothetical protein